MTSNKNHASLEVVTNGKIYSKFIVNDFENYGMQVELYSWDTVTEIYENDGKNVRTRNVLKEHIQTTVEHVLNDAQYLVKTKFCNHVFNIKHQFCSLKSLRDCKLSNEIQSLHFGGSRHKLSLHTSVLYSSKYTKSFCTVSRCLEHGPAAIWTHLYPIPLFIKENNCIDTLHIVSDGPKSEYRFKTKFIYSINLSTRNTLLYYQHGILQKPGILMALLNEQHTGWFHKEMTLLLPHTFSNT